jgi:DNA invertase Pin-like site-specific DNA recombinase
MRVAIYARFSSDLQDARSITDQLALAREHAARQGWLVVGEFTDAAISGASMANRPGLRDLMRTAEARCFDVVLTESLDRLSRDLADSAALHRQLAYWGVRIVTLADGDVTKILVAVKGLLGSLFLDDLAQKTRRGQVGRVRAGRIPGGRCYGYDVAHDGEDRGKRTINEAEAAIVRRIFAEYVGGSSPLAIVKELNREAVPAPRGGSWSASTLNGSRQRQNGILSNSLYVGRLTYNRQHFVKDPANGRRQARKNDRSQWMTAEMPELAIIETQTWEAAQARRRTINAAPLTHRRGPKRLLSGLLKCGACGASFIVVTKDHVACSAYRNKRTCDNKRTIRMGEIEQRVLTALKRHLLAPDAVATAVEAYRVERQRLSKERTRDRNALEREISEVGRHIDRMIASIKDGVDPKLLVSELNNAQAKREALERQLRLSDHPDVAVLHPQAAAAYRQKVVHLQEALARGDAAALEAVALVRGMVCEIRVTPARGRMELDVVGDLAALLEQEQGPNKRDFISGCGGPLQLTQSRLEVRFSA